MNVRIHREKTAIGRGGSPSLPLRRALDSFLIHPSATILDYGCDRGEDVGFLRAAGYKANGYDPHYAPDPSVLVPSPVVFLTYVLNVIEDKKERMNVLRHAWSLTQDVMFVSTRPEIPEGTPMEDGVLTSLSTFQTLITTADLLDLSTRLSPPPVKTVVLAPSCVAFFRKRPKENP